MLTTTEDGKKVAVELENTIYGIIGKNGVIYQLSREVFMARSDNARIFKFITLDGENIEIVLIEAEK